jgi:hypothetical protein
MKPAKIGKGNTAGATHGCSFASNNIKSSVSMIKE